MTIPLINRIPFTQSYTTWICQFPARLEELGWRRMGPSQSHPARFQHNIVLWKRTKGTPLQRMPVGFIGWKRHRPSRDFALYRWGQLIQAFSILMNGEISFRFGAISWGLPRGEVLLDLFGDENTSVYPVFEPGMRPPLETRKCFRVLIKIPYPERGNKFYEHEFGSFCGSVTWKASFIRVRVRRNLILKKGREKRIRLYGVTIRLGFTFQFFFHFHFIGVGD